MHLSPFNHISIIEVVFYTLASPISIYLCFRQNLRRNLGWLFLVPFVLLKVAGASTELSTAKSSTSDILHTVAATLSLVAISLLLLTALGHLSQARLCIAKHYPTRIATIHLLLPRILAIIGLILAAHGGTVSTKDLGRTGQYRPSAMMKVAVVLYLAIFAAIAFVISSFLRDCRHMHSIERHFLFIITASLPLISLPLIYEMIQIFTSVRDFRVLRGSVTLMACMSLIPEIVLVSLYLGAGVTFSPVSEEDLVEEELAWSMSLGRRSDIKSVNKHTAETVEEVQQSSS